MEVINRFQSFMRFCPRSLRRQHPRAQAATSEHAAEGTQGKLAAPLLRHLVAPHGEREVRDWKHLGHQHQFGQTHPTPPEVFGKETAVVLCAGRAATAAIGGI